VLAIIMDESAAASGRYSTRKRKRITRYTNDAFAGLNLDLDQSEHEETPADDLGSASEENFTPDAAREQEEEEDEDSLEDANVQIISSEGEGVEGDEDNLTDDDLVAIESDPDGGRTSQQNKKTVVPARTNKRDAAPQDELHTRGTMIDQKNGHARDLQTIASFGTDAEAKAALLKGMDRWFDEITMPSRRSDKKGRGGMCHSFFVKEEFRQLEATRGWDWYYEKGGERGFRDRQKSKVLTAENAGSYMPNSQKIRHILLGPQSQQRVFNLPPLTYLNTQHAFSNADQNQSAKPKHKRRSWILNAGENVQALDWCPNQSGSSQYLAIATISHPNITTDTVRGDTTKKTPGFAPADQDPAAIQIWEFAATPDSDAATLDMKTSPFLAAVICTDWGEMMQMRWCPSLRNHHGQHEEDLLGLLAIICRDGVTRVLEITLPSTTDTATKTTHCIHISTAAFESKPPDTISTCLAWLSSTHLAIGHANGHIAVHDISQSLCRPRGPRPDDTHTSNNATPLYYAPLSPSYLLALHPLLPSYPHLILATSTTGILSLHSLPNATTSYTSTSRTRLGTSAVCWLESVHHVLSAEQSQVLRSHNLKQFHQSQVITHTESVVSCMASSAVHASVAIGEVNGNVMVLGPVRRIMAKRTGGDHYSQKWFGHTWRRGRPVRDTSATTNAKHDDVKDTSQQSTTQSRESNEQLDYPTGLTRLTFGYAVESLSTPSNAVKPSTKQRPLKKKSNTRSAEGMPIHLTTIYELQSGVTTICWNPNVHVGGWAAAGCGDGIVVVEDLCWDDV